MRRSIILLIMFILLAGCGSKGYRDAKIDQSKGETLLELDVNKDGKVDCLWAQDLRDPNNPITLWRKDDLNFDGKFDVEQQYKFGKISLEKLDLDFDGSFDVINHYENGILSVSEYSLKTPGKTDMWVYYDKGNIVKKEVDTKGTGKPDYFEFYKDSKIDRVGRDMDGDGIIDKWEQKKGP